MNNFIDSTLEINSDELKSVISHSENNSFKGLNLTTNTTDLSSCNTYIITVPTPIDSEKKPDFSAVKSATKTISQFVKKNDIIIYESTVYPGATEEICIPIIENISGLELNKDFFVGYSPERINPGDKERTLTKILKITSGSNRDSAIIIDNLYKSIIDAGTYMAKSIKVAEAAKVIENSQRDINIAFINELAKILKSKSMFTRKNVQIIQTLCQDDYINYTDSSSFTPGPTIKKSFTNF